MERLLERLQDIAALVPLVLTLAVVVLVLFGARRLLEAGPDASGKQFRNQLVMLGLSLVGLIAVVLALPVTPAVRGQLLGLLGLLLSAGITLASTSLLGNALGGLMLRAVRNFRTGDFIRVESHFGRVSERGLFHTEIQTEDRDLTTLPNLFLVTNPVTVIRASGTIVSATLSLGYDAPRQLVEKQLLAAARDCGLAEPFVQVTDLKDFAVSYRVAGLLGEVKQLLTFRSGLRKAALDHLHRAGIEIVSPTYMHTRALERGERVIPEAPRTEPAPGKGTAPESVIFDKAEEAASLDERRRRLAALDQTIKEAHKRLAGTKEEGSRATVERRLASLEARRNAIRSEIEAREGLLEDLDEDDPPPPRPT